MTVTTPNDPFIPARPAVGENGRLWSFAELQAGWNCRWCGASLHRSARAVVYCAHCDVPAPSVRKPSPTD